MNLDTVITQLRAYAPMFQNRVAGAADYATGLESSVNLPLPACFVFPLDDAPTESSGMGGPLRQQIEERIAVVVEADNSPDRRGQTSVTTIEAMKYAIFAAILNWNPSGLPRAGQGFRYGGGHLLGMDRARIFWQFEFYLTATIDQDDGFIPTADYLENIDITGIGYPEVSVDIAVDNQLKALATMTFTA